jgi:hypothetical protein
VRLEQRREPKGLRRLDDTQSRAVEGVDHSAGAIDRLDRIGNRHPGHGGIAICDRIDRPSYQSR